MTYDELIRLFTSRRSCRKFKPDSVPDDAISGIMEAGRWTPSSHNSQNTFIIRLKDEKLKEVLISKTASMMRYGGNPFYDAPEILIVFNTNPQWDLALLDGSMTVYNMALAAETLGLGSCWVNTAQYEAEDCHGIIRGLAEKLGIDPASVRGIGYLAVGIPECAEKSILPRKDGRIFTV